MLHTTLDKIKSNWFHEDLRHYLKSRYSKNDPIPLSDIILWRKEGFIEAFGALRIINESQEETEIKIKKWFQKYATDNQFDSYKKLVSRISSDNYSPEEIWDRTQFGPGFAEGYKDANKLQLLVFAGTILHQVVSKYEGTDSEWFLKLLNEI